MSDITFSVVIVSLNPGHELLETVNSVLCQTYKKYEIIIKDGHSADGSLSLLPKNEKIKVVICKDLGIYDAMNQAIYYATGDYIIYLNCGDKFFKNSVLMDVSEIIETSKDCIYYGDCYTENRNYILHYPDKYSDYDCFTKTLCHQATFYPRKLLIAKKYDTQYKIAADYNFYISAYKKDRVPLRHLPIIVAAYQGGGVSETHKNRNASVLESIKILKENFSKGEYLLNYFRMFFTGRLLKRRVATSKYLYKYYCKIASLGYSIKNMMKES